jgi:hypothetical protein
MLANSLSCILNKQLTFFKELKKKKKKKLDYHTTSVSRDCSLIKSADFFKFINIIGNIKK